MSDRVLLPLLGLAAVLMIALAAVWPQGLGARSPGPFGHQPMQKTASAKPSAAAPAVLTMAPVMSAPQTVAR